MEAAGFVAHAREQVAAFFGSRDPDRAVFAASATDALNLAIQGLVSEGDHVVSTRLEHNSVLRPLFHLKERGCIDYDLVPFDGAGLVDPSDIDGAIRPNTKLVVVCHGSQVLGTVQPVAEIAAVCAARGVPLLLDAAQTAGQVPIDMQGVGRECGRLLGPQGSAGTFGHRRAWCWLRTWRCSPLASEAPAWSRTACVTPSRSRSGWRPAPPTCLGIIGLSLGLDYLQRLGLEESHEREMALIRRLRAGLAAMPGVNVLSPAPRACDLPLLTCTVDGMDPEDVGAILDGDYGIAVRTGLHCAPFVHADLGADPAGSVRFSVGHDNGDEDIDRALEAMAQIAGGK